MLLEEVACPCLPAGDDEGDVLLEVWKEILAGAADAPRGAPAAVMCGGLVKTLAPPLWGVPMVKSSSKSVRCEELCFRRLKASRLCCFSRSLVLFG